MLDTVQTWLQTYPGWEGTLQLDYAEAVPGNSGLYPKGFTELSRREDVQGNLTVRCSCTFTLRRMAAAGGENAKWLLELQRWVADQSRLGLAPRFGDDPGRERIRAFEGRLDRYTQAGTACYTVQLSVEFTKYYRGE